MLKKIISTAKFLLEHPLTKSQIVKTLYHYMRWQIGARLINRPVIIPWVDSSKLITGMGESGSTGNLYAGLMDYEDMLFLLHALRPTETFVDIGANIGAYTILASKVIRSPSIAYEAIPETFERLLDQIHINRINDLVCAKNNGVGDKHVNLFFINNLDTMNKVSINGKSENSTQVEMVTLDDELDKNKNYFIKIDVEGFEFNVIKGGNYILALPNVMALILELNDSGNEFGYGNDTIHNEIIRLNFTAVKYNPSKRSLSAIDSYNKNGKNTIYVKDLNLMQSRCISAPKRCIHSAHDIYL
jgi:FkbM family methyltransferase